MWKKEGVSGERSDRLPVVEAENSAAVEPVASSSLEASNCGSLAVVHSLVVVARNKSAAVANKMACSAVSSRESGSQQLARRPGSAQ
jgi:hypothetical protein